MMLKALIVDDEPIILNRAKKILEESGEVEVIGILSNGKNFIEAFQEQEVDFLVIDVGLPDQDGMEVAREIRKYNEQIPIIFLTGLAEFAVESYTVDALDYIMKPFTKERFFKAIEKVKRKLSIHDTSWDEIKKMLRSPNKVIVKQETSLTFLDMERVFLLRKEGKLTAVLVFEEVENKLKVKKYLTRESMKEVHSQLDQNLFVRTHNSFIVNVKWIHEVVRFSPEAYKINYKGTKEYALINRNKLSMIVQHVQ